MENNKDDYNLINSRAISDYCRSINYQFNTEELAVLVYRNERMLVEEKIAKYKDLIDNYSDMEVIKRINCDHYDSVKKMIQDEINRLERLKEELISNDEPCVYDYDIFSKELQRWDYHSELENVQLTFNDIWDKIEKELKDYDEEDINDIEIIEIVKKYVNSDKKTIRAKYVIKNKQLFLLNITDGGTYYLDIDNIYIDIPTPFRKGDILKVNHTFSLSFNSNEEIIVLDYLSNWRKDLRQCLDNGNYDSSDMTGYGYFFESENSTKIINDHKFNYDCFEYYEEELNGKNRILKAISSFIKGKIDLELFLRAYDYYKAEYDAEKPIGFTKEGLKLAGIDD